jgi:hypothetical protein
VIRYIHKQKQSKQHKEQINIEFKKNSLGGQTNENKFKKRND